MQGLIGFGIQNSGNEAQNSSQEVGQEAFVSRPNQEHLVLTAIQVANYCAALLLAGALQASSAEGSTDNNALRRITSEGRERLAEIREKPAKSLRGCGLSPQRNGKK